MSENQDQLQITLCKTLNGECEVQVSWDNKCAMEIDIIRHTDLEGLHLNRQDWQQLVVEVGSLIAEVEQLAKVVMKEDVFRDKFRRISHDTKPQD